MKTTIPNCNSNPKTKIDRVLLRLQAGEILTVWDIIEMGINRPTNIIWKLRKRGEIINSTHCTNKNTGEHFVKYYLVQEKSQN